MRIVLFGPPASGKGTQAYLLKDEFNIPHLSTGDLLRRVAKEDSEWGEKVRAVPVGQFASDELVIALLKHELEQPDYKNGVLLDGFPRTQNQAQKMSEMGLDMDVAIQLLVDEELLIERIINRRVHPQSGRIYNLLSAPPQEEGLDDITKEPLVHRDDDKREVVAQRFNDYNLKTQPAIDTFAKNSKAQWIALDGTQDSQVVFKYIVEELKKTNKPKVSV